jgi:outer membrane protein assembly factor BamE (lipoprotein component of BamABCDE complex)
MRATQLFLLCAALGGCSLSMPSLPSISSSHEAPASTARPADQLVGKNIDTLVAQLGQPTRSQPLDNDQTSYVWQIETPGGTPPPTGNGGLYGDGNSPGYVSEGYAPFCRINVVATANGVITQANTEESNGTGTPNGYLRSGNVCEKRLKAKSRV